MNMAILNYPIGVGSNTNVNPGWIQFDIYERKTPKNSIPLDTINLYLPSSMRNPSTTSWGVDSLGMLGNVLVSSADNALGQGASDASWSSGGMGMLSRIGYGMAASTAAAIVRQAGGSTSSESLMGAVTGQVANPYLTAIFKGVDFRTFEMSFKFVPVDEKDCEVIDKIIRTFRGGALPPGESARQTSFLGYPNEFEIRYIWRGKENRYLHKFKRCVLTAVDVDYTGMGLWAAMRNGFPAESNMTLRFSEIEIVLRDDVKKGNY